VLFLEKWDRVLSKEHERLDIDAHRVVELGNRSIEQGRKPPPAALETTMSNRPNSRVTIPQSDSISSGSLISP
jgi:hypothetical protein